MMSNSKKLALALALAAVFAPAESSSAQYTPDWASLDRRETPQWWQDAKFGIFIHWGVYSVPAFSAADYSEWYWHRLVEAKKPEYVAFHHEVYGADFTYADFVPLFTAELFDPEYWASIFKRSGAQYVVLTSKHHDGYTLWPSEQADQSWGRPWNSMETGPERDLVGDLTAAVRAAGLRMGLYYSLYEWFNPLYTADVDLYVDRHMIPQFKDLVQRYEPSVIFSDGEWHYPAETWRSPELLAWLYNESPVADEVVVNDRWGKGARHTHGGYWTTEYGSGLPGAEHPWEENRGMAHSFGYSRTEKLDDYHTGQELILMLVDIVSRGGNFLLDIGPTADGRIPVIMQQRLVEIGDWLDINGEAIYGTRTWKQPAQWSEGEMWEPERKQYMGEYDILELTLHPKPGRATKDVFFTRKGDTLYAITPRYPRERLVLAGVRAAPGAQVTLLGHGDPLPWTVSGEDLVVQVPTVLPGELPVEHAYVFRISEVER